MKRVVLLTFDSFVNDSRILKEADSLKSMGFNVDVVAHGDKNLRDRENINGVSIVRFSYLDRTKTKSSLKKLRVYFSFLLQSIKFTKSADFLHCNDLITLPIGVIIKKFYKKDVTVVYDAHEFETQINGLKGIKKRLVYLLEKSLIRYANSVITVSPAIAKEYRKLYNLSKVYVVLNTPKYQDVKPNNIFREKFNISNRQTIFLYQGSLHEGRGIEELVDCFENLDNDSMVIVFMGFGDLEDYIKYVSKNSSKIFFQKAVLPDEILLYTSSADFGISMIEDSCLSYKYSLPNKMFEYLMANIPVLISDLPEMRRVVRKYQVGVIIRDNINSALKEAMRLDRDKLKVNIDRLKKIYNWQNQEKILKQIYKKGE